MVFKDKKDVEKLDTQKNIFIAQQLYLKAINYGPGRTSKPHSQTCKNRILAEIAKTPEGQACIAQASDRLGRTVAEMGEMHRN